MKIDYQVIKRYLDGNGTEEDKSQIITWYSNLEAEKELRKKSRQYWEDVPENVTDEEYDETIVLGRIYREIIMKEEHVRSKPKKAFVKMINFMAKAAAILFLPLLALYISKGDNLKYSDSEIIYTSIYSPLGTRTMFYLPDGSKGWLNGGSYLEFAEGFPGKTRGVSLKGEAFFNVKTDAEKPFVVSTKNLNIKAKGTSFNVLAWDDVPETEIVLVEGKLDIYYHKERHIVSLAPGKLLRSMPKVSDSYIQKIDVDMHIAWVDGRLVFREDPFLEVVKRINRWYNVNIVIKDEILETYKYVATFQDETLDEILKMLAMSAPISYRNLPRKQLNDGTFEKRTIELYYNPSNKK